MARLANSLEVSSLKGAIVPVQINEGNRSERLLSRKLGEDLPILFGGSLLYLQYSGAQNPQCPGQLPQPVAEHLL